MQTLYEILGAPFGWIISLFYGITNNYLLSIFCLTVLVRLCLLPASISQQKGMAKQARLQPKLRRIQKKYEGDQRKIQEETQALYAREGTSAMTAGCLPTFIQLIIMLGLFQVNYHPLSMVLRIPDSVVDALKAAAKPLAEAANPNLNASRLDYQMEIHILNVFDKIDKGAISGLTSDMVARITQFSQNFNIFGIDLSRVPDYKVVDPIWAIPILSGLIALLMSIYSLMRQRKLNPEMAKNPAMGCTMLITPIMQVWFGFLFPVSVGLYSIMSVSLSFLQMVILNHVYAPKKVLARLMVEETIYRRSKEENTKKMQKTENEED